MSIFTDCNWLRPLNQTCSSSRIQGKAQVREVAGGNACSSTSPRPSGSTLHGPSLTRSPLPQRVSFYIRHIISLLKTLHRFPPHSDAFTPVFLSVPVTRVEGRNSEEAKPRGFCCVGTPRPCQTLCSENARATVSSRWRFSRRKPAAPPTPLPHEGQAAGNDRCYPSQDCQCQLTTESYLPR